MAGQINITKAFLTAGRAIFTVANPTGTHYTFRVIEPQDFNEDKPMWFVGLLTGPGNTSDYSYLGLLVEDGRILHTRGSKVSKDAQSFKVAQWAIGKVWRGEDLPEGYSILHSGRCGRCGRDLTTPESLASGLGPICAGRE
jgi:hypothetical protein